MSGFQSVVPGPEAAPGTELEKQILSPHPGPTKSKPLGRAFHILQALRVNLMPLMFKNLCDRSWQGSLPRYLMASKGNSLSLDFVGIPILQSWGLRLRNIISPKVNTVSR